LQIIAKGSQISDDKRILERKVMETVFEFNKARYVEVIAAELKCSLDKARSLMEQGLALNVSDDVEQIADTIILNNL
jgi:hypothetical protein